MSDQMQVPEPEAPDAHPTMETSIRLEPAQLQVAASGGFTTHQLSNTWENRLAFKIKTSDNEHYRVSQVHGFIDPGASVSIEVSRLVSPSHSARLLVVAHPRHAFQAGPARNDVLLVQLIEVSADDQDPQAPFKLGPPQKELRVQISATD
jgi:hypothetical protein